MRRPQQNPPPSPRSPESPEGQGWASTPSYPLKIIALLLTATDISGIVYYNEGSGGNHFLLSLRIPSLGDGSLYNHRTHTIYQRSFITRIELFKAIDAPRYRRRKRQWISLYPTPAPLPSKNDLTTYYRFTYITPI